MEKDSNNRELEHRIELLEKDYKIMEVNIDGTLKTMQANIDCTLKDMRTGIERNNNAIERYNTEAAKREARMIITIAGLIVGGIAILGFILT